MIYFLGQAIQLTNLKRAGVITGMNSTGAPLVTHIRANGGLELHEVFPLTQIEPVFEKDKNSPSGKKIYYGDHCRKVYMENAQLRTLDKEKTTEQLKKIDKLIKQYATTNE